MQKYVMLALAFAGIMIAGDLMINGNIHIPFTHLNIRFLFYILFNCGILMDIWSKWDSFWPEPSHLD